MCSSVDITTINDKTACSSKVANCNYVVTYA